MARRESEGVVTLSVFDRLIDEEPKTRSEAPMTRAQSVRELKAALKRDLEWLLNTRQYADTIPEGAQELPMSLVGYGLPDICSMSVRSAADQRRLVRMLELSLTNFEPRLENIKITLLSDAGATRTLRFVIDGFLNIDPAPEHVSFDTVLELSSGEYQVKGDSRA